jgi:hypothetical protein
MSRFVHEPGSTAREYAPSFFDSGYLDSIHEGLVERLEGVRGKLEASDQLKLYEAGHFAEGVILEVGRLQGKSTIALALGAKAASHGHPIYSVEQVVKYLPPTEDNLREHGVYELVTLIQGDSATQIPRVPQPLDTVFLDADHSYEGVRRDLLALRGRIKAGGVLMFHDYYHPLNESGEYGVQRAVDEAAEASRWEFRGRSGGIALYEQC